MHTDIMYVHDIDREIDMLSMCYKQLAHVTLEAEAQE